LSLIYIYKSDKHINLNEMIIGIPKEIKNNKNHVALTPAGVKELSKRGHELFIQSTAGLGSGLPCD